MEVKFYGANCVRITDKKISITIDDNLEKLGLKTATKADDICIFTDPKIKKCHGRFIINGPGEYEISETSIIGIPAKDQLDQQEGRSTIYSIEQNSFIVAVIGHINPDLNEDQIEKLGVVDLLILPIGGNGYTVDAHGATQLIKKIEPKIVIPTHFADTAVKYEVIQSDIDSFLKEMGVSEVEYQDSFKLKENELGDKTKLVLLNRVKI